jgi:hypothetical protein
MRRDEWRESRTAEAHGLRALRFRAIASPRENAHPCVAASDLLLLVRREASRAMPRSRSDWTTSRHPTERDRRRRRSCSRGKAAAPPALASSMHSGTATVISRTRGSLLLSCTRASVAEFRRSTLARTTCERALRTGADDRRGRQSRRWPTVGTDDSCSPQRPDAQSGPQSTIALPPVATQRLSGLNASAYACSRSCGRASGSSVQTRRTIRSSPSVPIWAPSGRNSS